MAVDLDKWVDERIEAARKNLPATTVFFLTEDVRGRVDEITKRLNARNVTYRVHHKAGLPWSLSIVGRGSGGLRPQGAAPPSAPPSPPARKRRGKK